MRPLGGRERTAEEDEHRVGCEEREDDGQDGSPHDDLVPPQERRRIVRYGDLAACMGSNAARCVTLVQRCSKATASL